MNKGFLSANACIIVVISSGAGYVINSVNSSLYGQGKTIFVVTKPLPATHNKRGLTMNIMGSIVFADNQNWSANVTKY